MSDKTRLRDLKRTSHLKKTDTPHSTSCESRVSCSNESCGHQQSTPNVVWGKAPGKPIRIIGEVDGDTQCTDHDAAVGRPENDPKVCANLQRLSDEGVLHFVRAARNARTVPASSR